MWSNIQETLTPETPAIPKKKMEEDLSKTEAAGKGTVSFHDLVEDMSDNNEQKDASLQYYFICLLHLANENVKFFFCRFYLN
jgi:hypothetical protein